jgi:hypothetical protein
LNDEEEEEEVMVLQMFGVLGPWRNWFTCHQVPGSLKELARISFSLDL